MQRWLAALGVLVASASAAAASADSPIEPGQPVEITADHLEIERRRQLYVADGSVLIRQGDRTLRADWVAFCEATGQGVASGNVVVVDGPDTLHSQFVGFDITTFEGVLFDARYESTQSQFDVEAEEITKTGAQTYSFENGAFTTCQCPDPNAEDPWRIEADHADLEVEGYGTARNTTFEVLGVPVVWLPWMLYPIKTERQSGVLFPQLAIGGRNGFEIGLPLFWAATDNVNVTFTPRWLQKRGVKGDLDVEFLLGEKSGGDLSASFVYDDDINANSASEPFDRERWALSGRQDLYAPWGWNFKSELRLVSDNQYLTDFGGMDRSRTHRYLESTAFGTRAFGPSGELGVVGSVVYADDLQNPDDQDRDDLLLHRFPHLEFSALPTPMSWGGEWTSRLVPALGVRYTNWQSFDDAADERPTASVVGDHLFLDTGIDALPNAQERGSGGAKGPPPEDPNSDDLLTNGGPEGDGLYQEGEPLADRGQRVIFTPRLGVPWRFADLVEAYPEVGWHQTLYGTDEQGFEERHLFTSRLDLRTRVRGDLGGFATHVLEPRIGYALVTQVSQSGNPLFVPRTAVPQKRIRQLDLDNVVLDPADRIESFNGVTFGFGNRIYGRPDDGAPPLLADFDLSAQYEFSGSRWGPIYLDGRAYPRQDLAARFNVGFDPEEGRLDEALLSLRFATRRGHQLGLSYRYLRSVPRFFEDFPFSKERFDDFDGDFKRINQLGAAVRISITESWAVSYRVAYTFEKELLLANAGGIEYLSKCRCWAVRVEVIQDRVRGARVNLSYSLLGLGRDDTGRALPAGGTLGDLAHLGFLDAL